MAQPSSPPVPTSSPLSSPRSSRPVTPGPSRPLQNEDPSSPPVRNSSPIRGKTHDDKKRAKADKRRKNSEANRLAIAEACRQQREEEGIKAQVARAAQHAAQVAAARTAARSRAEAYVRALAILDDADTTWGNFIAYISDPQSACPARYRYHGFFKDSEQVRTVLEWWTSRANCKSGRETVQEWAISYLERLIYREGEKASASQLLQSREHVIDKSFVLSFNLLTLYDQIKAMCPNMTRILHTFSTTKRQEVSTAVRPSAKAQRQRRKREKRKQEVSGDNMRPFAALIA